VRAYELAVVDDAGDVARRPRSGGVVDPDDREERPIRVAPGTYPHN
jgi:hypothetical protein